MTAQHTPPVSLAIYLTLEGFTLTQIALELQIQFPELNQKELMEIAIFGLTEAFQSV